MRLTFPAQPFVAYPGYPGYAPAQTNLTMLNRIERGEIAGATRLSNGFADMR